MKVYIKSKSLPVRMVYCIILISNYKKCKMVVWKDNREPICIPTRMEIMDHNRLHYDNETIKI